MLNKNISAALGFEIFGQRYPSLAAALHAFPDKQLWIDHFQLFEIEERHDKVQTFCKDAVNFVRSKPEYLVETIKYLLPRITASDQLVDMGCGDGFAGICLSIDLPIKKTTLLDQDSELIEAAQENIKYMQKYLGDYKIEVIKQDAAFFQPEAQDTLFYLYCPFWHDTFKMYLNNLYRSYLENKRNIQLIYVRPYEGIVDYINSLKWLNFVQQITADRYDPYSQIKIWQTTD